jgi:hypothetical protein
MGYLKGMERIVADGSVQGNGNGNGQVYFTPSISIEPREQDFILENGPFMKILTGSLSRKAEVKAATSQSAQ